MTCQQALAVAGTTVVWPARMVVSQLCTLACHRLCVLLLPRMLCLRSFPSGSAHSSAGRTSSGMMQQMQRGARGRQLCNASKWLSRPCLAVHESVGATSAQVRLHSRSRGHNPRQPWEHQIICGGSWTFACLHVCFVARVHPCLPLAVLPAAHFAQAMVRSQMDQCTHAITSPSSLFLTRHV